MILSRFLFSLTLASLVGSSVATAAPAAKKMSFFACHKEFQDAKKNGTLHGQSFADFKTQHCSETKTTSSNTSSIPSTSSKPASPVKSFLSGGAVFPTRIDPEFSSLSAGKARQKTCLKQYHLNKENGKNGELKWIQRGGGYYSQCNTRLKGSSAQ